MWRKAGSCFLHCASSGASFTSSHPRGGTELSPPTLVFFRTAPAALLLVPFAVRSGRLGALLRRWPWVLAFTLTELAVPWVLLAHAEEHVTSSVAGLLIAAVPLIGALLYRLVGTADRLDVRRLTGLVVGFAGVAVLAGFDVSGGHLRAVAELLVVAPATPLARSSSVGGSPTCPAWASWRRPLS